MPAAAYLQVYSLRCEDCERPWVRATTRDVDPTTDPCPWCHSPTGLPVNVVGIVRDNGTIREAPNRLRR